MVTGENTVPDLSPGQMIDRYRIGRKMGSGGYGAVYRADHIVIGTPVALKVLYPERAENPEITKRFIREARAAASIGHPNIISVLDAGRSDDGYAFLAMEMLNGSDLQERLDAYGPLPVDEALELTRQILSGLAAAHAAGIVHRDLKPANIFVMHGPDGLPFAKILDFGISKVAGPHDHPLTKSGTALGTPSYMAPEQLDGARHADGRADLYAVSMMFYEMVTGQSPFPIAGYEGLIERVRGARPTGLVELAPWMSPALALVIERSLARDPDARWPSAEEMAAALADAAGGAPLTTGPQGVTTVPRLRVEHASVQSPAEPLAHAARPNSTTERSAPPTRVHVIDAADRPRAVAAPGPGFGRFALIASLVLVSAVALSSMTALFTVLWMRSNPAEPYASPTDPSPTPTPVVGTAPRPIGSQPLTTAAPESTPNGNARQVRYEIRRRVGAQPHDAVVGIMERARSAMGDCAVDSSESVYILFSVDLSGEVVYAEPDRDEVSSDQAVAACVGNAIREVPPAPPASQGTLVVAWVQTPARRPS